MLGGQQEGEEAQTGWTVLAVDLDDSGGITPRADSDLDFLHEDLPSADPTGADAHDLFA